jgi:hypothetical protein
MANKKKNFLSYKAAKSFAIKVADNKKYKLDGIRDKYWIDSKGKTQGKFWVEYHDIKKGEKK